MKFILKTITALTILCSLANPFAYLTIKGGASKIPDISDTQELKSSSDKRTYSIHFNPGYDASIAGGWVINQGRLEIEWGQTFFKPEKLTSKESGKTSETVIKDNIMSGAGKIMLNGYYDFNKRSRMRPYLGAGIGFGSIFYNYGKNSDGNTISTVKAEGLFAYQFLAGINYKASKSILILFEYRFLGLSKDGFMPAGNNVGKETFEAPLYINSLNLGFTFTFA